MIETLQQKATYKLVLELAPGRYHAQCHSFAERNRRALSNNKQKESLVAYYTKQWSHMQSHTRAIIALNGYPNKDIFQEIVTTNGTLSPYIRPEGSNTAYRSKFAILFEYEPKAQENRLSRQKTANERVVNQPQCDSYEGFMNLLSSRQFVKAVKIWVNEPIQVGAKPIAIFDPNTLEFNTEIY
jgi:hypothetical protein